MCMLCFVLGEAFWAAVSQACGVLDCGVCWLLAETCCAGSWHAAAKEDKGETAKVGGSCAVSFACRWKRGMTGHAAVAACPAVVALAKPLSLQSHPLRWHTALWHPWLAVALVQIL